MSHSPNSVLITGANRGIGLGLVKHFLEDRNVSHVFAGTRDLKSKELEKINDPRLVIVELDVENDQSIRKAKERVSSIVGSKGLNLLVNNAGVLLPHPITGFLDRRIIDKHFSINCTAPFVVTQIFLPLLKAAANTQSGSKLSIERAGVVTISSFWGSVSLCDGSREKPLADQPTSPYGILPYRMSKSAAVMLMKSLAADLAEEHILFAAFCPGWVITSMGGESAMLTVDQSSGALVNSFKKLTNQHNGNFYDRDLQPIPY